LQPCRSSAEAFWRAEVMTKRRSTWQKQQWSAAIRWYLQWVRLCKESGRPCQSLAERVRHAIENAGARRGLAYRTRLSYGAWGARFAQWAGSKGRVLDGWQKAGGAIAL